MNIEIEDQYQQIRYGGAGFYEQKRGLIAVWGKEAVQFLDGLISNDMKTLAEGHQMLAAFPNAQGRLLAVVRVMRQGDRFLFETEEATREKVFNNLFRFTFAGDFFVEDITDDFRFIEVFGLNSAPPSLDGTIPREPDDDEVGYRFMGPSRTEIIAIRQNAGPIRSDIVQISADLYETLRIESGIPKYGIDMDETTIVPELGLDGLISYNKGCYIGQEIIARIHFRGHVAKRLTGIVLSEPEGNATGFLAGDELTTSEGKNAGRITSVAYSPRLEKPIALAYVRYDHLAAGTELTANGAAAIVTDLPFVSPMV